VLRFTDVASERDVGNRFEQSAQTLHLVVGKRIHWIKQQCPNAGASQCPCFSLSQKVVENRQEEALGLSGPGAGCNDQVSFVDDCFADRHFLMEPQRPLKWEDVWRECPETWRRDSFSDERFERVAVLERRGRLQVRST
jgi:hypothetical protein